jgi:hypothetical protein
MKPPAIVEAAALDGDRCGLRAAFRWDGQQYRHTIEGVVGGAATTLLECVDPEPPFQEAVVQPVVRNAEPGQWPASPVVLLTGAGGGLYWSATVTPVTDLRFAVLSFDLACRGKPAVAPPAVRYRWAAGVAAAPETPDNEGVIRLATPAGDEYRLWELNAEIGVGRYLNTCRLTLTADGVALEPRVDPSAPRRSDNPWRWGYELGPVRR